MKVLLANHGFPPEMHGGTEESVLALAHSLVADGHEPVVVSGSDRYDLGSGMREEELALAPGAPPLRVLRIQRVDTYYGHWQKGVSHAAGELFDEVLRRERPDVVHVHHWIRLSRDLVTRAATLGVPSVLTLHDLSASCLVHHRVRPSTRRPCDAPLAPDPCLECAASVFQPTPWIDRAEEEALLARFRRDAARELMLARAVIALSHAQKQLLARFLPEVDTSSWIVQRPAPPRRIAPAERPALDAPRLRLGSWGTVHPLKGLDVIVEALRLCVEAGHDVELRLAGQLADPAYLERVLALAPPGRVSWLGPFPAGALAGHEVTRVHAFVTGTRARETWGVVLDEALALRLPVLLPAHGAFVERFEEGRGARFYEPCDPLDLARVLGDLAARRPALDRLHASLPAAPDPDETRNRIARRTVEIYRRALEAGPPESPPDPRADRAADEAWASRWEAGIARAEPGQERPPPDAELE